MNDPTGTIIGTLYKERFQQELMSLKIYLVNLKTKTLERLEAISKIPGESSAFCKA
jgi:hypothetical protein